MNESAIKYLRQSNGGQHVDTDKPKCCNSNCSQGRTCPVHQAVRTTGFLSFLVALWRRWRA